MPGYVNTTCPNSIPEWKAFLLADWLLCFFIPAESTVREVLAGRQLRSYRWYNDVQIFHFSVPSHVSVSVYNFTANDSLACEPRNITA